MNEQTIILTYDPNGALIQKDNGPALTRYEWDCRGRLQRVLTNEVEIFRADYCGDLKCLRKTESTASTIYRHDGLTVVQEENEAGAVKEWVRGDRGTAAVGGVLYSTDENSTNTYTYNGVGSTAAFSDGEGTVRHVTYDAFGKILEADEGIETERLANTKELDESTGLYFHGMRYYDVEIGRYISVDPARDGVNYYVYANNAPLNYVDPTGMFAFLPLLFGLGAGLGIGAGSTMWDKPAPAGASPPGMEAASAPLVKNFRKTRPGMQLELDLSSAVASSTIFVDAALPLEVPSVVSRTAAPLVQAAQSAGRVALNKAGFGGRGGVVSGTIGGLSYPVERNLSALYAKTGATREPLGSGEFGTVYRFTENGEDLVIKKAHPPMTLTELIRDPIPEEMMPEAERILRMKHGEQAARFNNNIYAPQLIGPDELKGIHFPELLSVDPENSIYVSRYIEGLSIKQVQNSDTVARAGFANVARNQRSLIAEFSNLLNARKPSPNIRFAPLDTNPRNYKFCTDDDKFYCVDP